MVRLLKILVVSFISVLVILTILFEITHDKPPLEEIKKARVAISQAQMNKAHLFSADILNMAVCKYDSAMFYWKNENQRCIFFRDFSKLEELAGEAMKFAVNADGYAITNSGQLKENLNILLDSLSTAIVYFKKHFDFMPLSQELRMKVQQGKLFYSEAKMAYDKAEYIIAVEKAEQANELMIVAYTEVWQLLERYFINYSDWKKWAARSIDYSSKARDYCIVIDKYARECMLYQIGKLKYTFKIELGQNWMGNKNQQGDKSTPEGIYKVSGKYSGGQTRYYKALSLDYPNEDDVRRFNINKKNGVFSTDAVIGNMIEIQGHGGKGVDWTDGCIALSDSDMDILFASCAVGTQVTILGSLKPLSELLVQLEYVW